MSSVNTNTKPSPFLTFAETCELLGIHVQTGRKALREGTFPLEVIAIGERHKCRRADVERLLHGDDTA
jgi:excisionase family DNA binding protein